MNDITLNSSRKETEKKKEKGFQRRIQIQEILKRLEMPLSSKK